jgi:PEP-CTERM motif
MKASPVFLGLFVLVSPMTREIPAHADVLVEDFTIENGRPSAPGGEVTFELDSDGAISASVVSTLAGVFEGFAFDSAGGLPQSNFAPAAPDVTGTFIDNYGAHQSGFLCFLGCGTSETWTIGTPGEFTSVWQALGGGAASTDFYLLDLNHNQWGANAVSAAIPEPATWTMMALGFAGLGYARYRASRNTAKAA